MTLPTQSAAPFQVVFPIFNAPAMVIDHIKLHESLIDWMHCRVLADGAEVELYTGPVEHLCILFVSSTHAHYSCTPGQHTIHAHII